MAAFTPRERCLGLGKANGTTWSMLSHVWPWDVPHTHDSSPGQLSPMSEPSCVPDPWLHPGTAQWGQLVSASPWDLEAQPGRCEAQTDFPTGRWTPLLQAVEKEKKKKKAGLSSVFYISPLGEEIYTMIPCCWPILAYFPFTSYCIIWPWPTIKKDLQAVSLFSLGSHPKTAADRCWKWPTDSLSDSLMPFHWLLPPPGMFSVCLETSYFPFQTQPS